MNRKRVNKTISTEEKKSLLLYKVKLECSCETEICVEPESQDLDDLKARDSVVLETRYGNDLVDVLGVILERDNIEWDKVGVIERRATQEDFEKRKSLDESGEKAFDVCRDKIREHKLDMKLVEVHYLLGEPKIVFFFTSDTRVDFRELVKDLVSVFRLRIELRQIGVRDEARIRGGVAVCGRDYCCHGVTDKLVPVSIKMAKEQNLTPNSLKISGPCGRLLCCLSFECDYYKQELKKYPPEGYRFRQKDIELKVIENNIFSRNVMTIRSDGHHISIPVDVCKKKDSGNDWELSDQEYFSIDG